MEEYNKFVIAINKIFEQANIMKTKWNDIDNLDLIENIENIKTDIKDIALKLQGDLEK